MQKVHRRIVAIACVTAGVVFSDQIAKALVSGYLETNQSIGVLRFFNLVYVENPGAAFGIFREGGVWATVFLSAISVAAIVIIGFLLKRSESAFTDVALSLIAGGAAGNLMDRVRFGSVVDFLDFHAWGYHWPAFNVADIAVTIGVVLMLIGTLFKRA